MDGCTFPYLDVASAPAVGSLLLDPRPALVLSSDGRQVLWANAAGAAFLDRRRMGDVLRLTFSDLNPIRQQAARLARLLPSDTARLEILRFGRGVALDSLPAACRRLNLAQGQRAVLATAVAGSAAGSVTAEAERLVDAIGAGDCLAAIIAESGSILAASGGVDAMAPMADEVERVVGEIRVSSDRKIKTLIGGRQAGAVRFETGDRTFYLLIVGPVEAAVQAPAAVLHEPLPVDELFDEIPVEAMLPEIEVEGSEDEREELHEATQPPATARFLWETDGQGRFVSVSSELAGTVGEEYATVAGLTFADVAHALQLDPAIASSFSAGAQIAATVYWPVAGSGECVAIDLAGFPVHDRGAVAGYRGFGLIRLDDRRADTRSGRTELPAAREAAPPVGEATPPPDGVEAPLPPMEPPAAAEPDRPERESDLDDAARKSVEEGSRRGPDAEPEPPSNVVQLDTQQRGPAEALSGNEREAFRRIAEALKTAPRPDDGPRAETASPPPERPIELDARLLDRLPIGIVIFRDRKTLYVSRSLLELLGHDSPEAFADAGGAETIFPEGRGVGDGGAGAGDVLAASHRDGHAVPVRAWLHAVPFGGATALMLSIAAAVPDRSDAEAMELTRSEARIDELAAILDTATDGVIVVDARGRIESLNRSAEALFGIEASDYAGRYFTDLLADESQKPALDYLDGLAANGVASVLNDGREVIGRVPQGGLIPLFMTMGRVAGTDKFCAVLRDITHWKNVEGELVAARRAAEAANQQKSDFLARISHEIRTPLNAIIGFSEVMMEERFGPIGNARYRDYLRDIHVSGAHLMSLINDLLDLSKIEAGKVDLSFESVAPNAVVQECVALMQPQANRERIIIRTSLAAELPNIVADARSLRQIMLNLLSNAIKFTRPGGQVIVSTALEDGGEVTMRIRDTGIGMSEKDIEIALKPFRQVALARDDRDHGTGLGLPLTKALVEANRATFTIESAPDQGTLVRITFPTTRVLAG